MVKTPFFFITGFLHSGQNHIFFLLVSISGQNNKEEATYIDVMVKST